MTRGPAVIDEETKKRMRRVLEEIQSGAFAREWMEESRNGAERFKKLQQETFEHPIEQVGARLRSMMPWLRSDRLVNKATN
jgi:ketol-acid reductoisomerase